MKDALEIIETQIAMLNGLSKTRELDTEEIRKLESLVKSRSMLLGKPEDPNKTDDSAFRATSSEDLKRLLLMASEPPTNNEH